MINVDKNINIQLCILWTKYMVSILLLNGHYIFSFFGGLLLYFSLKDILFLYGGSEKIVFPFEVISSAILLTLLDKILTVFKDSPFLYVFFVMTIFSITMTYLTAEFIKKSSNFIKERIDSIDGE